MRRKLSYMQRNQAAGRTRDRGGGTTLRQKNMNICIRMLSVFSINQIGISVLAVFAGAFQLRTAADLARGELLPISPANPLRWYGSERSDPGAAAHRHVAGDRGPASRSCNGSEVNRADVQVLAPTTSLFGCSPV